MKSPTILEDIYLAAAEKATAGERAAYLDGACAGDAELRRRVERLLAAHPQAGAFVEELTAPATGQFPPQPSAIASNQRLPAAN